MVKWFYVLANRQGIYRGLLVRKIVKNCKERFHFFNKRVLNFWNVLLYTLINNQ